MKSITSITLMNADWCDTIIAELVKNGYTVSTVADDPVYAGGHKNPPSAVITLYLDCKDKDVKLVRDDVQEICKKKDIKIYSMTVFLDTKNIAWCASNFSLKLTTDDYNRLAVESVMET